MADHIGIVLKNESTRHALVVTDRKGACGGCQSTPHGCRSCLTSAKMESRVANPLGAQPGDLVTVHLASESLYAGAAILYLLPVMGVLLGAFMGLGASAFYGVGEAIGSIGGAAAGLCLGFSVVILLDRSSLVRRRFMPTITGIVTRNVGMPGNQQDPCCGRHA